mgnify:CR=1 FL=1
MKYLKMATLVCAVTFANWVFAGIAESASMTGRLSTVVEWFDDARQDAAIPIYQYGRLNIADFGIPDLDFKMYGRVSEDLKNTVDADSRLYYGYFEKNNVSEKIDLKLGRQFISTTAGASIMDGLFLKYGNPGSFEVKLFGGGDVSYYEGYDAKDLIGGAEVSGHFMSSLDLGLSYLQRWEEGELANELIGLDFDYDYRTALNVYSETQYDYLSDGISYFLGGFNYHRSPTWSWRTEYLYSLPVFSSTSIYSVFAVSEYQEAMTELSYKFNPGLRSFLRYTREFYTDFEDAAVYEIGLEQIRIKRFSGYLTGILRDDEDGQDLQGIKIYSAYVFHRYLHAGAGAHVDVLERRIDDDDDETTSSRVWIDATSYLNKQVSVQAKVEYIESDLWDEYYRGRVRLNLNF